LVGWVGLRGAVPVILATFPLLAGIDRANEMFNIVFFIVLTSVLVQGSTIPIVARWLRVAAPMQKRLRSPLEFESTEGVRGALTELELEPGSPGQNKRIVELGLPKGALLILIGRNQRFFVPNGGTELHANDTLFFLSEPESLKIVEQIIGKPD
jgi:cell volume regulation protein A